MSILLHIIFIALYLITLICNLISSWNPSSQNTPRLEMVALQNSDSELQADVVFIIEATSMNGTYVNELKSSYITPILE